MVRGKLRPGGVMPDSFYLIEPERFRMERILLLTLAVC